MTMKPEYNYGDKITYTVRIRYISTPALLTRYIFWLLFRKHRNDFDTSQYFQLFEDIDGEQLESLKPEMAKAQSYTVCENHYYTLLRDDILIADLPNRHKDFKADITAEHREQHFSRRARSLNGWYSRELSQLNEYSFEQWARNEQIDEAYRLTILPSFSPARVIRLWKKDDVTHLLYKIRHSAHLCKPRAKHKKKTLLKTEKWQEIREFMNEHFWTAETWYSPPPGAIVLDGEIYLFEGWRDGEYKLLDDHGPSRGAISSQAVKLFQFLVLSRIQQHSYRRIYD